MHCPLCGSCLRDLEYEGVLIHTCDSCGGELLAPDQLAHIVRLREMRFDDELRAEIEGRSPIFGLDEAPCRSRALTCPGCSGAMRLVNYGGDSGICLDRCDDCRIIFLEREELEKVQALMERWDDAAPAQLRAIAGEIEAARREAAEAAGRAFAGSRFAFVNALVNRLLDAA